MYTLADFSTYRQPKQNKHIGAAKSAIGAGVTWGGTGALGGLLARPNSGGFQRKVAAGAMAAGMANSLRKSYLASPKPKIKKSSVRRIKSKKPY